MIRTIFLLVIIGTFIECKKDSIKDSDLLDAKWTLSYIQDTKTHAITHYPGDTARKISIVFNDSSDIVSFFGVCNGGAGTYTYSSIAGEIKITDLITTLIGCKYVEWETYTIQNLYYASRYKIDGTELVIYSGSTYNLYFNKN